MQPCAIGKTYIDERVRVIETATAVRRETLRELAQFRFIAEGDSRHRHEAITAVDPDLSWSVHDHVGDRGIRKQSGKRSEAGQLVVNAVADAQQ